MNAALLTAISGIVLEGMKVLSTKVQRQLHDDHADALKELSDAQNKIYPDYNDAAGDLALERLRILLEAYGSELQKANLAVL